MTQTGLSLGTPQYMSPEQAMGERAIDARTDIYALGAVTYEMLAGEPPFTGPTVQAIVARLLSEEPRSLAVQRKSVPVQVELAVHRALEKLPADRWHSAPEFAAALTALSPSLSGVVSRGPGPARSLGWTGRLRDPVVLALAAVAIASTLFAVWARRTGSAAAAPPVVRFSVPAARSGAVGVLGLNTLTISRDGTLLVYVGQGEGGRQQLMLRRIGEVSAHLIPGTENGNSPVLSPDGKWVAFFGGHEIYKVPIEGGRPQPLGTVPGTFTGMSWSATGSLVVAGSSGIHLIPETGGPSRELTRADPERGEVLQNAVQAVDEAGIVALLQLGSWQQRRVRGSRSPRCRLVETTILDVLGTHPLGIVDGTLVYVTIGGALMGLPFDVAHRRATGEPIQLANDLLVNSTSGLARAALSHTGTLFYQSGTLVSDVVLVGARGDSRTLLEGAKEYAFPRLSPDAGRLAITEGTSGRRDVWVYELSSGTPTRLTREGVTNERPEWTPDGKRVLFRTDRQDQRGRSEIWWRPVDLSAPKPGWPASPTNSTCTRRWSLRTGGPSPFRPTRQARTSTTVG